MKKTRQRTLPPPVPVRARPFALQPLAFASLVALAGPALALPTGGTVVGGQATIQNPAPALQVVTQGTPKAVIDWTTFSIAPGETVRFDQPSASAVLLNRVTGYDPSAILGRMQSNGRIFLLNPYGVVFGAGARVDVGGLVASSLSLSTADFMAGRFALGMDGDPDAPAQRGEVRNEGTISAPGGVVVLAGPVVTNAGTIEAAGGRVGLAAAQEALVDVEGDGLLFFRTSATEAGNRLAQLGRIQADGGSVELRAAARGAFADTVLNLGGVVQARSLGVKNGRVVIDGGEAGITRVAGTVDAGGAAAGERGGQISVRGQKVLLDHEAVLDASGDAGGGKVTVGGDWQGRATAPDAGANAAMTHVAGGARIDVAATGRGDGGTAVVWADQSTRLYGTVDARGGPSGGNGGRVEVSGRSHLDFAGTVRSDAPLGLGGELLLDPADITIAAGNSTGGMSATSPFEAAGNGASNLDVDVLNGALGGNGVVRVSSGTGSGGSITVNANVTATGSATLQLESNGAVTLNNPVSLNGGSFIVRGVDSARAASFTSTAGGTISTTPSAAGAAGGSISIATSGSITLGAAATTSGGPGGGSGGNVTLTTDGAPITLTQANALAGTVSLTGSTVQLNNTLATTVVLDTTGTTTLSAAGQALNVSGSTSGTLHLSGASATVAHTGALDLGTSSIAGPLDVTASGAVTQSGLLSVGGTTRVDAGAASIALTQSNVLSGTISLTGGSTQLTNTLATTVVLDTTGTTTLSAAGQTLDVSGTTTGALRLTGASATVNHTGALNLGPGSIAGTLDVTASGAVTQSGALSIGGTTRVDAGAADIALTNGGNDFVGLVTLAGGAIGVVDANDLNVLATPGLGRSLSLVAQGTLTIPAGAIDTGAGDLTLSSGTALVTSGTLHGANVSLGGGSGGITLNHNVGASGTLTLSAQDAAITQLAGNITVGGTTTVASGSGAITLASAGNDFQGVVTLAGAAVGLADANHLSVSGTATGTLSLTGTDVSVNHTGALNLGASSAGGNMGVTASGAVTQSGVLAVGGTTSVDAGANAITLTQANALAGTVSLTGSTVQLNNTLATTVVLDTTGTTTLSAAGQALNVSGSTSGTLHLSGASATVAHTGALDLGTSSIAGPLDVTASGAVTQSGLLSVGGTTRVDAGTASIALTQSNVLSGTISLTGGSTQLTNTLATTVVLDTTGTTTLSAAGQTLDVSGTTTGALRLTGASATVNHTGALNLGPGSIAGTLDVTASGAVTQSGALSIGGTTRVDAGAADIALTNGGNDFVGLVTLAGGAIGVVDANDLNVLATPGLGRSLSLVAQGTLTIPAGAIDTGAGDLTLSSGTALVTSGTLHGANVSLGGGSGGITLNHNVGASGTLTLSAQDAAITQLAGNITVGGTTTVASGSGAITLASAGNDFQGAVALAGGAVQIRDASALALGGGSVASLALVANGAVTQTGAIVVAGPTSVAAGTGDVTLAHPGNDFAGPVTVSGGAISVVDATDLNVVATPGANRSLALVAGGTLTIPGGNLDTGSADLTLSSGTGLGTSGTLRGANVTLGGGSGGIVLNNDVGATGALTLTTTGAAITQSAGNITVGTTTDINSGTGNVTLLGFGNDFQGAVNLSGGITQVRDANTLTLWSVAVNWLGVASTGPLDLGSGSVAGLLVALSGGGAITQSGALTVGGNATIDAGGGSVTLTQAGNDFATLAVAGGAIALRDLDDLTLGAVTGSSLAIDTSAGHGAVTQTGALSISGATTIAAGTGNVTLTHAGNQFSSFAATAGAVSVVDAAGGIVLGPIDAASLMLDTAAGHGAVTQTGAVQVGGATSIAAGSGHVTLTHAGNDFGTFAVAGGAIAIADSNALTVTSLVSGPNQGVSLVAGHTLVLPGGSIDTGTADLTLASTTGVLDVNGPLAGRIVALGAGAGITLGANVTSSADQTYAGSLSLTADAALNAGAGRITLQGAVDGGGHHLALTSGHAAPDAIRTGAAVANVAGFAASGHTTLGGNVGSSGDQTYASTLVLAADAALDAGAGRITLQGAVDGGGHNLMLASGHAAADAIRTGAAIADVASFSAAGHTTLGGNVTASGAQTYSASLALAADVALDAGAGRITLHGPVDGGGHHLALTSGHAGADAIRTGAAVANVASFSATGRTTLGGNVTATGDQTYSATLVLAADAALDAGAGRITLQSAVDGGGHHLALTSSHAAPDAIRTGAAIANVASFSANGNTTLGGSVTASGAQTYAGPVQLTVATTLTGTRLDLLGTVDGAQALTLAGSGTTTLGASIGGTTALSSITASGGGSTHLGSSVTTTGVQDWGDAIVLTGTTALSGSTLTFGGTIDGAHALTAAGSASTTIFNGAVGGTNALASLDVTGPTQLNGGSVTTTGRQDYAGTVMLGADTVLAANGIGIAGALDGAHALTVVNAGTTRFGGTVGSNAALSSLTTQDQGAVVLDGAGVTTTGAQRYSGSVQYADRATFSAGALSFGADVTGGQDLALHTDTLDLAGRLAGAGTLSIAPRSADRSIGVAGGAGDLQVTQALLGGAGGFAAHHIGRTDGRGPIAVGALTLASDTTLRSGSGDLTLAGSVDGGFALSLDTGGTTRILGSIGTNAALRSLTTDNHGAAADWDGTSGERTLIDVAAGARIVTTEAQTYHDPLVAVGAVRFDASAVTATQATNRFDGRLEANAGQLDLRSRSALVLGDVTLAAGGRIETDETLELAGALRLNGGTLSLVANGQPRGGALTDPDLEGRGLALGPEPEASATIFERQGGTGSVATAPGSLLVLRSPQGGSILLDNETDTLRNDLLGGLSAVSGTPGRNTTSDTLGFIRITSTEIHAVGAPPAEGSPAPLEAGIEGDVLKLSADQITTGATGQLRARLPFDNFLQGSDASIPGLTLIMSPTALTIGGGFGLSTPDGYIQVRVGNELGGFLTVRPRPATGENAFVLLAGPDPRPFYDLNAKSDTVRVFYNGDAPRTPQETGALSALMATVEDARQTRFDEAVRTENVKSRLRSGVIAEVGAGRPATVGRESIRLPSSCDPKGTTLQCE